MTHPSNPFVPPRKLGPPVTDLPPFIHPVFLGPPLSNGGTMPPPAFLGLPATVDTVHAKGGIDVQPAQMGGGGFMTTALRNMFSQE